MGVGSGRPPSTHLDASLCRTPVHAGIPLEQSLVDEIPAASVTSVVVHPSRTAFTSRSPYSRFARSGWRRTPARPLLRGARREPATRPSPPTKFCSTAACSGVASARSGFTRGTDTVRAASARRALRVEPARPGRRSRHSGGDPAHARPLPRSARRARQCAQSESRRGRPRQARAADSRRRDHRGRVTGRCAEASTSPPTVASGGERCARPPLHCAAGPHRLAA